MIPEKGIRRSILVVNNFGCWGQLKFSITLNALRGESFLKYLSFSEATV